MTLAIIAQLTEMLEQEAKMTPAPWSTDWYVMAGVFEEGRGAIPPGKCTFCGNETLTLVAELPALPHEFPAGCARKHVHKGPSDDWHEISNHLGVRITGNYDYEDGGVCSSAEDARGIVTTRNNLKPLAEFALAVAQWECPICLGTGDINKFNQSFHDPDYGKNPNGGPTIAPHQCDCAPIRRALAELVEGLTPNS